MVIKLKDWKKTQDDNQMITWIRKKVKGIRYSAKGNFSILYSPSFYSKGKWAGIGEVWQLRNDIPTGKGKVFSFPEMSKKRAEEQTKKRMILINKYIYKYIH